PPGRSGPRSPGQGSTGRVDATGRGQNGHGVASASRPAQHGGAQMSEDLREESTGRRGPALPDRPRLVLASFLMLFVELALIRWTAANDIYLAHLTNFVLLASFLGIGIGFLLARRERDLFPFGPLALAALVGFLLAFPAQTVDGPHGWMPGGALGMPALPRWVSLSVVFLLTVAVLACLGQEVGRTFSRFPALEAYRLDVLGSLAGIVLFAGVSFVRLPPLGRRLLPVAGVGVALVVVLLGAQSLLGGYYWSPYYKIRAVSNADGSVKVDVNNTPHQTAHRLQHLDDSDPFYRYPYTYAGARDDVLIIGAGTGNDVAVALDEGAKRV